MEITSEIVKKLRDLTGAGMMDCKRALESTGLGPLFAWGRVSGAARYDRNFDGRLFGFAFNNPVMYDDPSGYEPFKAPKPEGYDSSGPADGCATSYGVCRDDAAPPVGSPAPSSPRGARRSPGSGPFRRGP